MCSIHVNCRYCLSSCTELVIMAAALIVLLLSSALVAVQALPTGAPAEACDSLSPSPSAHGAQPQSTASPYGIDLSPFNVEGQYLYTPGRTYTGKPSTQPTCTYIRSCDTHTIAGIAVTHTVYVFVHVRMYQHAYTYLLAYTQSTCTYIAVTHTP